jgi:hypothetical protein
MRFNQFSIAAAMFAGAALALSAGSAQADDWDHHHSDHRYERHHGYYEHERPVIVHERAPVIVERERPVFVAPPVVYPAVPQPSGLNLNFNIPLN